MSTSRPVRIARTPVRSGDHAIKVPTSRPFTAATPRPAVAARPHDVRPNVAGTQRANRLAVVYAASLLVLYGILAAVARAAPGGGSTGSTISLELFAGIAVLFAAIGVLLALFSAPQRVELAPEATVFISRFGGRLRLGPLAELDVRVIRRFPSGLLAPAPVEHVEVAPKGKGRRRAFLLEEHLLDARTPSP